VFNGILWILRTGSPWRDMPDEYPPWQTVYHHFNQWRKQGLLAVIVEELQIDLGLEGCLDHHLWCIDGSNVRAARCAAGGGKKGIPTSPSITLSAAAGPAFRRRSTSGDRHRIQVHSRHPIQVHR
jgi:putative transposase